MAARYLVATGTWDASNTSIWSATSGGAAGASVPTGNDAVVMDAASGAVTVTLGANVPFGTMTLTGFTGTIAGSGYSITSALNGNTLFTGATTCTITGPLVLNLTYAGATGTRTINPGALTEANAVSVRVTAGTDNISTTASTNFRDIDFTGFSGTVGNTARTVYGNWNSGTASFTAGGNATTFAATSGTQVITSNGVTLDFPVTVNAPGATVQLADALTLGSTRTFRHTAGGLDLNGKNLTAGFFASTNTNVRSITSGVGQFFCTAAQSSGTIIPFNANVTTNLTFVDRPTINYSGNCSGTCIRQIYLVVGQTEALSPDVNVTAGTDFVAAPVTTNMPIRNLNFAGFSGTATPSIKSIYGNVTLSPTMVWEPTASSLRFIATSGTQIFTTSGIVVDCPIVVSAPGATVQLADALTMGTGRTLTHAAGGFDANNKNVTCGVFDSSNTNVRSLSLGSGMWTVAAGGGGNAWIMGTTTNLTFNPGTATINMSAATAKVFQGGGKTYYNLNQGGAGDITWTGVNTFNDIQNTVVPCTLIAPANTTTTVANLSLAGTAGNLVTLQSSSAGTRATLSKASGTVNVSFLSIKDSAATGGATWQAKPHNGNLDAGNNTGWTFPHDTVAAASMAMTAYAPGVDINVPVPLASMTLTAHLPSVEIVIPVPVAAMVMTAYAPTFEEEFLGSLAGVVRVRPALSGTISIN